MREKYKIWDKKRKKIYPVQSIHFETDGTIYEVIVWYDITKCWTMNYRTLNNIVLLPSTKLKDRSGIDGFQFDIVKTGNGRTWVIKHGTFYWNVPGDCIELYGFYLQSTTDKNCRTPIAEGFGEIIGNIFENPDMVDNEQ